MHLFRWPHVFLALILGITGCSTPGSALGRFRTATPLQDGVRQTGWASYYGRQYHGRKTASGEKFDMNQMTAAHRTLSFGQQVRVINLENNSAVVVRINDRGPFKRDRIIDLSFAAAKRLNFVEKGTARVRIEPANTATAAR